MVALGGVQCDHVNSLRDELRTPHWRTLLRRIGENQRLDHSGLRIPSIFFLTTRGPNETTTR